MEYFGLHRTWSTESTRKTVGSISSGEQSKTATVFDVLLATYHPLQYDGGSAGYEVEMGGNTDWAVD